MISRRRVVFVSLLSGGVLVALLLGGLLIACQMKRFVADNIVSLLEETESRYMRETSYLLARDAGASLVVSLDGLIAASPENERLLALGVRISTQFALAFVDDLGYMSEEQTAYARSLYSRAKEYGLRALGNPQLDAALEQNAAAVREALKAYGRDDVSLLFWTGLGYGGWINRNKQSVRAVADLPIAVAFMERVLELDDEFYYGGAHLFLGQYYGSRAKELGGDPERAREELQRVLELTEGKLLLAKVYLARYYAVPTQDPELFEQVLEEVLDAPDDLLPEEELLTAVAKHKAEKLLFEQEDFFLE